MAFKKPTKYNFLAEPDRALLCVICLEVAEEPWQHNKCGRLLCHDCLKRHGKNKPCPNCREPRPQYFADSRGKREIKALWVLCSNSDSGCKWTGTVGALQGHSTECAFALVPCPQQCRDGNEEVQQFIRRELGRHLAKDCSEREYACWYCGKKGKYANIMEEHDTVCEKKIISCPNEGCASIMERLEIKTHIENQCPYTMLPCKYKDIGCAAKLARKDIAAHEANDGKHLHMALDMVNALQVKTMTLNKEGSGSMTLMLTDYQKKKDEDETFIFPPFYSHPNGYLMEIRVLANGYDTVRGTHIMVLVSNRRGKYDTILKFPFTGKINIMLLNQREDDHHCIAQSIASTNEQHVTSFGVFPNSDVLDVDVMNNTQYLRDDTLYFRVSIEVPDYRSWLQ